MSNCNGEIQHDRYPHTPQGLFIYSIDFSLPLWSQFWQNNDTLRLRELTRYLLCWRAELLRYYQANQQMTSCWPQRHNAYQKLRDWKHPPQLVAHDRASFYARKGMTVETRP